MKIKRLIPISYCFGVTKAINQAIKIRAEFPNKNVVFFGELVHNQNVIDYFKSINISVVSFTKENALEKIKHFTKNDVVIFSAHGHDKAYENYLIENEITFFDTTCIKVKNNLDLISNTKSEIIYVGKENHPETFASLSYSDSIFLYDISTDFKFDYSKIKTKNPLVLNQSTLSILEINNIFEDIKKHLPEAIFVDEICDASRVRQTKILELDENVDLVVVVGDKKSSNTTKLYNLSCEQNKNVQTIMVNSLDEIKKYDLKNKKQALIASGTSAPMNVILEIEHYLEEI